ncbi:hypothetical protein NPIL_357301 [Nephila pilipes]|uniref:Microtubule-associated proteins 1A/1B light chain 3C n=1 Tax=Nephila pilipes TaxID=299642 RepID=A0A8X6PN12_NEPPI|nr:hypothetical protein NPIL_357301 [Nephila pilipes]
MGKSRQNTTCSYAWESFTLKRLHLDFKPPFKNSTSEVIVEKSDREKVLPYLDRVKFLVPLDMTMSQFVGIVRARLKLKPTQTFYLMLNNKSVATMSRMMGDIYDENKYEDGFLYATYAAQEMYG